MIRKYKNRLTRDTVLAYPVQDFGMFWDGVAVHPGTMMVRRTNSKEFVPCARVIFDDEYSPTKGKWADRGKYPMFKQILCSGRFSKWERNSQVYKSFLAGSSIIELAVREGVTKQAIHRILQRVSKALTQHIYS